MHLTSSVSYDYFASQRTSKQKFSIESMITTETNEFEQRSSQITHIRAYYIVRINIIDKNYIRNEWPLPGLCSIIARYFESSIAK